MGRKQAAKQASSVYPSTIGSGRGTRTSSIFPYSVARPPTDFAPPAISATDPERNGPPAILLNHQDPFGDYPDGEDEEPILDGRETPLYARSDWGATTGTKTAFSRSSYPDFADEIMGKQETMTEVGDGPKTNWSRSSYDSNRSSSLPPPLPATRAAQQVNEVRDPYIHEPGTAWSQESFRTRGTQFGTAIPLPLPTTLPPSHTVPLAINKNSRQSVSNTQYSSALKSVGSRKPSQLVDIDEMTEDSHDRSHTSPEMIRPMTTGSVLLHRQSQGSGVENPFSPMFANTAISPTRRPVDAQTSKVAGHEHHRSTLPSILDLEQLAARPKIAPRPHSAGPPGTADMLEPPRFGRVGTDSPRLLTTEAQNKLGRMSVATARYSLPPSREGPRTRSDPSRASDPKSTASKHSAIDSLKASASSWKQLRNLRAIRWYRTWRPFINALHGLMAALLLTIALADQNSGLGWLIKIQAGGLATMPAVGGFGLGVGGWCQLDEDEVCSGFTSNDFASADSTFVVPHNPTIDLLYPLWVALTTMVWFQALFALSSAFLHFYLFFILSIPFSHLVDRTSSTRPDLQAEGEAEEDVVQKEVDIRARCERPPFEEYIWVWWAWWGFRRGPIGHAYAMVVGVLSVASGGLGIKFRNDASTAAMDGSVTFGVGAFVPFIVLLMTLDCFVDALHYFCISPRRSLDTFVNPPDPTPAAILLPPSEKPLALRHRGTRASTFFAAPTTARLSRGRTIIQPGVPNQESQVAPPLPASELDEETRRWLIQYPQDPELVPLIASLRQGVHNDDFVLSDVGLLYLRPDEGEPSAAALLVPPNGPIRREILDDAHVSEAGQHRGYDGMLDELERVFWWVSMEEDLEGYINRCSVCQRSRIGRPLLGEKTMTDETKSTYTGIKGLTGEEAETDMAVDMAVAMRKAEEEAARPWAG